MLTFEKILKDPSILDGYLLRNYVDVSCSGCGSLLNRQKRLIIRNIKDGYNGLYCSNTCKPNVHPMQSVICLHCASNFKKKPSEIKKSDNHFCCTECHLSYKNVQFGFGTTNVLCDWCGCTVRKGNCNIKRSTNHFCSYHCSSKHKAINRKGIGRRSKIEKYIEEKLITEFPTTNILFNDRKHVGYELDIYFPDLKLAIELNGIFHYKPIYGFDQLNYVISRDIKKFCMCTRMGISLEVFNISHIKHFTPCVMDEYYEKIASYIR